jgi:hypothetical protein
MSSRYVYISIGNSDNKLTQSQWSEFCYIVSNTLGHNCQRHGEWFSLPNSPFQNACWCVTIPEIYVDMIRTDFRLLCRQFSQDSIAWAEAEYSEITPNAR